MPFGSMPRVQNSTAAHLTLKENRSKGWLLSKGLTRSEGGFLGDVDFLGSIRQPDFTAQLPSVLGTEVNHCSQEQRTWRVRAHRQKPCEGVLCPTAPRSASLPQGTSPSPALLAGGAPAFNLDA